MGLLLVACSGLPRGAVGEVGVFVPDGGVASLADSGVLSSVPDSRREGVESFAALTVELLTVGCARGCGDVTVAAHGGHPPYTFRWNDGSAAHTNRVCPQSDSQSTVNVTDTALRDNYAAQTASISVTSEVLRCVVPDAGSTPSDAGRAPPDADAALAGQSPCAQQTVPAYAADGCESPTLIGDCRGPFGGAPSRTYEFPSALAPGSASCLVAVGNVRNIIRATNLNLYVAGGEDCSAPELLHDPAGSFVPPNGADEAQVICLLSPSVQYSRVYVQLYDYPGNWGDLDLRLCVQCPW